MEIQEQCKVPEKEQVSSILAVKAWFHEPIEHLRKLLDSVDEGCEHGHYYSQNHLEVEGELTKEQQELCQQLRGHPIPCASGSCSSLIRTISAIAVHYPQLRSYLHLLYCAKKYHQCILDIDSALSDFNHLMIAAGVSDSVELFQKQKSMGKIHNEMQVWFPHYATDTAVLNNVEDCLKAKTKIYCLPRTTEETRMNDCNPHLVMLWKANMGIQFVAESTLALAHYKLYVTGYVTKAERSNM